MLDKDNCLVLIVDMQERLVGATNAQKEAEVASKLIEAANILDIPIIVSEQYPKGLGHTDGTLAEFLNSSSKIIKKTAFSLLKECGVLETIKSYGKSQVILLGIETHVCVYQTAMDLLEKGYEVCLLKDGCKSRNEFEYETGIDLMCLEGVKISCLEIVLFELLQDAKNPNFKEVQALIK